ncbi:MAG TPA: FAD binding domain-containing protein [Longimicrobiales bacterium]|nr:FAD binding domain-containing protein [Longimicrobiales bacterium]
MLRLPPYQYHVPGSLAQAVELLARHAGDVMPIAGGTDLVPNMKHGLFTPGHLVALSRVPELRGVELLPGGLRIGATMTLADVAVHPLVRAHAPSLADAAGRVAGPQLRSAGTIGGNLCLDTRCTYYNQSRFWRSALGYCLKKDGDTCHVTKVGRKCVAAHSADTPPVLMTLGASMELAGPGGTRSHRVGDFFIADGIWNNVREPDELVTSITVPLPPAGRFAAFEKLRQRGSIDFPLLNVAVAGELNDDGTIAELRVIVSGLGSRPRVVSGLIDIAAGQAPTAELLDAVAERAHAQCHPLDNMIVDPEWRRAMVPVYVRRALRRALDASEAAQAA